MKKPPVSKRAVKKKAKPKRLTAAQKLNAVGVEAICEMVAECRTLNSIADDCKVTKWDVLRFLNSDLHRDAHMRAREAQADKHAEDILSIADELVIEAKYNGENVTLDVSSTAVARNRLRVDARKWLAAKMNAKKYGDKLGIGGADDLPAMQVKTMSTTERAVRVAALLAKAAGRKPA